MKKIRRLLSINELIKVKSLFLKYKIIEVTTNTCTINLYFNEILNLSSIRPIIDNGIDIKDKK